MRAGPLSDTTIIETLNNRFVSTWVLNRSLVALKDRAPDPDTRRLAKAVLDARQKGSPVDSLLFSAELDLLARQPANDLLSNHREAPGRYKAFLTEAHRFRAALDPTHGSNPVAPTWDANSSLQ